MSDQPVLTPEDHSGVKIPPPLIYAGIFVVGLILQLLLPLPALPQLFSRVTGLLFISVGLGLGIWSVTLFRRARTSLVPIKPSTTVVTSGPYRFTRNPMYLGLLFLYVGLGLWLNVLWVLILLPGVIVIVQRQVIKKEERYLERKFGAEYLHYKNLVRRWL